MGNRAVSGRVWLEREAWGGWAGHQHTLGEWVARVLHREADVAAKLAAHPDVAERHAFIWATDTSDMEVQIQLEPGDDHPRPVTPPTLPEGVTHVWVGGPAFLTRRAGLVPRPRLVAHSMVGTTLGPVIGLPQTIPATMTSSSAGRGWDSSEVAQCGAGRGEGPLAFVW